VDAGDRSERRLDAFRSALRPRVSETAVTDRQRAQAFSGWITRLPYLKSLSPRAVRVTPPQPNSREARDSLPATEPIRPSSLNRSKAEFLTPQSTASTERPNWRFADRQRPPVTHTSTMAVAARRTYFGRHLDIMAAEKRNFVPAKPPTHFSGGRGMLLGKPSSTSALQTGQEVAPGAVLLAGSALASRDRGSLLPQTGGAKGNVHQPQSMLADRPPSLAAADRPWGRQVSAAGFTASCNAAVGGGGLYPRVGKSLVPPLHGPASPGDSIGSQPWSTSVLAGGTAPEGTGSGATHAGNVVQSSPGPKNSAAPRIDSANGQSGGISGDVYLDGRLVGKWIGAYLGRKAGLRPKNGAGFDIHQTLPPPGMTSGLL
jgi:hypothetical protein